MNHRRLPIGSRAAALWPIAAILVGAGANVAGAASPGDFAKAWAIEGLSTARYYEISLPDEAIAATRARWSDAAVFDARNRLMTFSVELDRVRYAGEKEAPGWVSAPCSLVADVNGRGTRLRCESAPAVARTTGIAFDIRSDNYRVGLDLRVLDDSDTVLSTYRAGREGFVSSITIGFDAPLDGSTVIIEGLHPDQHLEHASMRALPEEDSGLEWREARHISGQAGDKVFVYATERPVKVYSAQISKGSAPLEYVQVRIGKCRIEACPNAESLASLDATDFAKDGESYPVRLDTFGTSDPFLRVSSFTALASVPRLRIGIQRPRLHFLANGTPPYAFAVGGERSPPGARVLSRDLPMGPYAVATLAPYHYTLPFWIIGDYAGPFLIVLALAVAGVWITRRPA
jgi:hypothetical protein